MLRGPARPTCDAPVMHRVAMGQDEDARTPSAACSLFTPDGSRHLWPRTGLVAAYAEVVREIEASEHLILGELLRIDVNVAPYLCTSRPVLGVARFCVSYVLF